MCNQEKLQMCSLWLWKIEKHTWINECWYREPVILEQYRKNHKCYALIASYWLLLSDLNNTYCLDQWCYWRAILVWTASILGDVQKMSFGLPECFKVGVVVSSIQGPKATDLTQSGSDFDPKRWTSIFPVHVVNVINCWNPQGQWSESPKINFGASGEIYRYVPDCSMSSWCVQWQWQPVLG